MEEIKNKIKKFLASLASVKYVKMEKSEKPVVLQINDKIFDVKKLEDTINFKFARRVIPNPESFFEISVVYDVTLQLNSIEEAQKADENYLKDIINKSFIPHRISILISNITLIGGDFPVITIPATAIKK